MFDNKGRFIVNASMQTIRDDSTDADLLAMTHSAPKLDRVVVMPRPKPVPPPVMKATLFLNVPGSSMGTSDGGKNTACGGGDPLHSALVPLLKA